MKKKLSFLIIIATLVMAFVGCGKGPAYGKYEGFDGYNPINHLVMDDYVKLDGVIDEEIWTEKASVNIDGAKYDQVTGYEIDESIYGKRSATVYTHIGEKAIYFAFDVKDKNLYYDSYRGQYLNTGVEVYFSGADQQAFDYGCWSVRVSPTGNGLDDVKISIYRPHTYRNTSGVMTSEWIDTKVGAAVKAVSNIDGTIMTSAGQSDYSTANNKGYVVEMAIDKGLLCSEIKDAMQYTAAFCQARSFTETRLNNSFIAGTNYKDNFGWLLATNDGVIEDKMAYLTQRVTADENAVIDGSLNESIWQNTRGRTFVSNKLRSEEAGETENLSYTLYSTTTDKGVYVGIKSNDASVYYYDYHDRRYSTGAEIGITVGGADHINSDTTLQYAMIVGGSGECRRGNDVRETGAAYAYTARQYFASKSACKVLGDAINSGTSDGWTGELFIPWSSFRLPDGADRNRVAIMLSGYRAYPSAGDPVKKDYVTPFAHTVYAGGAADMNPYERWFVFNGGKPEYDEFRIGNVALDRSDLTTYNGKEYYAASITAAQSDTVVTNDGYYEVFETVNDGEFSVPGITGIITRNNGDGTYRLMLPAENADRFATLSDVSFNSSAINGTFKLCIQPDMCFDGLLSESAYSSLRKLNTEQTTNGVTTKTEFTLALKENAVYVYAKIKDAGFATYKNSLGLGLELYLNLGREISSATAYQLRIISNGDTLVCRYVDNATGSWPWTAAVAHPEIERIFVDNNDGTYSLEARIPYSSLGVDGQLGQISAAPFTKFAASSTWVSTKINAWEGNEWTHDVRLYNTFDESGYAPAYANLVSGGESVTELVLIEGLTSADDKYEGEFTMSMFPDGYLPVEDADFGVCNDFFTSLGSGKYAYSIPVDAVQSGKLTVTVESLERHLDGSIDFVLRALSELYIVGETAYKQSENEIELWKGTTVSVDDEECYSFVIAVYADEDKYIGLNNALLPVEIAISGVTLKKVQADGNRYTVFVPVAALTDEGSYTLTATHADGATDSIAITLKSVADGVIDGIVDKTKLYVNFDGATVTDHSGNATMSFRRGANSTNGGVYTMNQSQRALQAKGVTLGNEFTVSMLINCDDVLKTWKSHYSNCLFTTGNVDGAVGYFTDNTFGITIAMRNTSFTVSAGNGYVTFYNEAINSGLLNGWQRFTFAISKANDTVSIKIYIGATEIASKALSVASTHTFNNSDSVIGIGAPATTDDVADPNWYVNSGAGDVAANHNIRLDNVLLYNGLMDGATAVAIDGYDSVIAGKLSE